MWGEWMNHIQLYKTNDENEEPNEDVKLSLKDKFALWLLQL